MELRLASSRLGSCCASLLVSAALAGRAPADPLPGEVLKFQQLPLTGGNANAPFPGHDETSTAYATFDPLTNQPTGWQGTFMADDFADTVNSPIVHVSWWWNTSCLPRVPAAERRCTSTTPSCTSRSSSPSNPIRCIG